MENIFKNEYLNKKIEPLLTREEEFGRWRNLSKENELVEHSYVDKEGAFEFNKGETKVSFKYSTPNLYRKFEDLFFGGLEGVKISAFKDIRQIDEFVIEKGNVKLNLNDAFSTKNAKIYFNIKRDNESSSCIDPITEIVFLEADPLTPNGLLTLEHELGHNKERLRKNNNLNKANLGSRFKVNAADSVLSMFMKVNEDDYKNVLEDERNAWAFALKDLRPFVEDLEFNLDGINSVVHRKCLKSYSDYIRTKLDKV